MHLLKVIGQAVTHKKYRSWIVLGIIGLTILLIARFFTTHPQYVHQLQRIQPTIILALIGMYGITMLVLVWMYDATFKLCNLTLPVRENVLLTAYSTVLNFFGPLQSGPGVRAVYLKTRHHLRLRNYMFATLVYYGFYSCFSALFLLGGALPWWQTALGVIVVASVSVSIIKWFVRSRGREKIISHVALRGRILVSLAAATLIQLLLMSFIYFIELKTVNPTIHFSQALSYTGAAAFALFVSITPGAIGFRETFLVFSEHIHHVSTANILAASLIDRSAYILFLLLLLLFMVISHAKDRLRLNAAAKTNQ